MKFKLDENLPLEIVESFRVAGQEIDSVQDEGLSGATDAEILRRVQAEDQVLLTMDKGIADVRLYPPDQYSGIVLFRPQTSGRGEVLRFVQDALPALLSIELDGHFAIVSARGIRLR